MKHSCFLCSENEGVNAYGNGTKICHKCSSVRYQKNKAYVLNWRKNNREKVLAYRRKYSKTTRKITSKKQDRVREMVKNAIKVGLLIRGKCTVCFKPEAQAHHDDYKKPFAIKWFCPLHHREYEDANGLRKKKYK